MRKTKAKHVEKIQATVQGLRVGRKVPGAVVPSLCMSECCRTIRVWFSMLELYKAGLRHAIIPHVLYPPMQQDVLQRPRCSLGWSGVLSFCATSYLSRREIPCTPRDLPLQ